MFFKTIKYISKFSINLYDFRMQKGIKMIVVIFQKNIRDLDNSIEFQWAPTKISVIIKRL